MRIGLVILPDTPWDQAAKQWRLADELGFDHAWTYDHLTWRERVGDPWYAALPTLAAAALQTRRIRLGPLVTGPNFRHPVPLAQEFMTLDDLSAGRMVLGLGAGTTGIDASALGRPPGGAARMRRFAEFTGVVERLLRERQVTHHGEFYDFEEARVIPGCVQRPRAPIAVAATGRRGIAVAARHADMWVTNGVVPGPHQAPRIDYAALAEQSRTLDRACCALGRDPRTVRRMVVDTGRDRPVLASAATFATAVERYARLGFTDLVIPFPAPDGPYQGDPTVLHDIAERHLTERR
ncbi:LLM class flavin-dependent oxidoreductase [Streptomyces capitiformicae]|uniref:Luciferase n=1 Tax=Streptomyces capitiformicae TaxID=2014920 RepID=A0A919DCI8_9ACTN|nr:LLM class flavin-dependent oxidoreductase [Streptomyces capitiformicae]GHE34606.1 luciferase [Streptomyces capitiformicae]